MTGSVRSHQRALALAAVLISIILALFAFLLPMASWRVDEYHDFGLFRTQGWSFFFQRLLTWSPRPFSETIAGLYHVAVLETGRPLTTPFLASMWAVLLIGPILWVRHVQPSRRLLRSVFVGAVLCLFLLGHEVGEVFFWPMGAVAYLPTLGAITALTFQVTDGQWRRGRGRWFCIACVVCAAGSSEVGAIFAIFFAATMVALLMAGWIGKRTDVWGWVLPLALGLTVMMMLTLGRGQLEEHVTFRGLSTNPTYLHHPWASLARSVPTYFRQLAAINAADVGGRLLAIGVVIKAALVAGLTLMLADSAAPIDVATRRVLFALAACLQATIFVSIAGAYYKFGTLCCERHDTMRQGFVVLTMVCSAVLVAGVFRLGRAGSVPAGVGLIGLTLALLLFHERSPLAAAYAGWDRTVVSQRATWDSGRSPGGEMVFFMPPVPPVVGGMLAPEQHTYRLGETNPWVWDLVMSYFGKRVIRLEPF